MKYNKKEGSFRTKKNGVEYRIYIDGKQKSFSGKTESECLIKCRKYIKQLEQQQQNEAINKTNISLEDYVSYWLITYKMGTVAYSTYDRLENAFETHIKDSTLGKTEMAKVTSDEIQEFVNLKKQTLSLSSLKKLKEILAPSFHHATLKGAINSNPMELVVFPKNDKALPVKTKEIECYTDQEVEKIALTSTEPYYNYNSKRYRYAPLYAFILNTGLRIGECLSLTWDDIDFEKQTINVNKTLTVIKNRDLENDPRHKIQVVGNPKTYNGMRVIPLNSIASIMLQEMKTRNSLSNIDTDVIFPNYKGEHLSTRSVQKTFERICNDIGVECKGLHALRHTFGSVLIKKKVDIKVVSELLGHSDVRFTYNRYIHIIKEQKAEAMSILDVTPILADAIKVLSQGKDMGTYDLIYKNLNK
jgi:site-specific recombinase XerD